MCCLRASARAFAYLVRMNPRMAGSQGGLNKTSKRTLSRDSRQRVRARLRIHVDVLERFMYLTATSQRWDISESLLCTAKRASCETLVRSLYEQAQAQHDSRRGHTSQTDRQTYMNIHTRQHGKIKRGDLYTNGNIRPNKVEY